MESPLCGCMAAWLINANACCHAGWHTAFACNHLALSRSEHSERLLHTLAAHACCTRLLHSMCFMLALQDESKAVLRHTHKCAHTLPAPSQTHAQERSSGIVNTQLWCTDKDQHSAYSIMFFTPLSDALARLYANPALQVGGARVHCAGTHVGQLVVFGSAPDMPQIKLQRQRLRLCSMQTQLKSKGQHAPVKSVCTLGEGSCCCCSHGKGLPLTHAQTSPDNGEPRKISSEEILYSPVAMGCLFMLVFILSAATYGIGAGAAGCEALAPLFAV